MGPVQIGDAGFEISKLSFEIAKYPLVLEEWRSFAIGLGVSDNKLWKFNHDIYQNTAVDRICTILLEWRSEFGANATLNTLIDTLEHTCGWKDVADHVWMDFHTIIPEGTTWTDLPTKTKQMVIELVVTLHGQECKLGDAVRSLGVDQNDSFFQNLDTEMMRELVTSKTPLELTKLAIPVKPTYYIPRVVSCTRSLSKALFQQNSSDKFVIEGLSLADLSSLAGNEGVDNSFPRKAKYMSRFICLKNKLDFEHICKVAGNAPVHLIHYKYGRYLWIKSSGNLNTLKEYVLSDEPQLMKECEFRMFLETGSVHGPIVLADQPGMGKSSLLANLCRQTNRKHVNIFISLPEFCRTVDTTADVNINSVISQMADFIGSNQIGRKLTKLQISDDSVLKYIYMDAFDEVPLSHQLLLLRITQMCSVLPQTKLTVSTRLHKVTQLEDALNCIAHRIVPLKTPEQSLLLVKYWTEFIPTFDMKRLTKFADALVKNGLCMVDSKQMDFAGIPLQCKMLAEIYLEDVSLYATSEQDMPEPFITTLSLYQLFAQLVDKKFERADKQSQPILKDWHFKLALQQLFPHRHDAIETQVPTTFVEDLFEKINNVGIIVGNGEKSRSVTSLKFIHRSFAEIFAACWLIDSSKNSTDQIQLWYNIMFEDVMNPRSLWEEAFVFIGRDFSVRSFYEFLRRLQCAESIRGNWKKIMKALSVGEDRIQNTETEYQRHQTMELVAGQSHNNDILYHMLNGYTHNGRSPRSVGHLFNAMGDCKLHEAKEVLENEFIRNDFAFPAICFFMDSKLLNDANCSWRNVMHNMTTEKCIGISDFLFVHLGEILNSCVRHDFGELFSYLLRMLSHDEDHVFIRALSVVNWADVMEEACLFASVELLHTLCTFIEDKTTLNLKNVLHINSLLYPKPYTLLHHVAKRGSFPVFDFMIKKFQPPATDLKLIIHHCVQLSIKLSSEKVAEKLQILHLLTKLYNNQLINDRDSVGGALPVHTEAIHCNLLEFLMGQMDNGQYSKDHLGRTLCHMATRYTADEYHSFVELLITKGFHRLFSIGDNRDVKPLHLTLQHGVVHPKTISRLASVLTPNFSENKEPYLYSALVGNQSKDVLKALIHAGADPFKVFHPSPTVLHVASKLGRIEGVKYFLSIGIPVNIKDSNGTTPLQHAFNYRNSNIHQTVQILLENNADVRHVDLSGRDVLWYAKNCSVMVPRPTVQMIEEKVCSETAANNA